ncbi:MAG TPA: hypothetical protein VN900_16330 [Stellaceae bacterium]|jgi:hypothetical protein|nr:hypothetical protein [Stellaceae bacterium]
MTAAAIHADTAPAARQGWRSLLWIAPLTALWAALNYWQPGIQGSGMPNTAIRLMVHALIAVGLWLALEHAEMTPTQRRNVWLAIMIPFTLWLAAIWCAAVNGVFRPVPEGGPPLLPLAIFIPVIIGAPILLRSKRIGQILDAMPESWLIALQLYRVFGAIFLVNWARGVAPGLFALPAGTGDVITGLLAVPVAISLASGDGRRAAIAWNIFGLFDFAVAIGMGLITAPGPLQLIVPSLPSIGAGTYPTVMIPAFAVPSSILLHALSLRQLRRRASAASR